MLPRRKAVGRYFIDYSNSVFAGKNVKWLVNYCSACTGQMPTGQQGQVLNWNGSQLSGSVNSITCSQHASNSKIMQLGPCPDMQERGIDREPFWPGHGTLEFEVDNYLNFYHAASGVYIMINTTPFPDVALFFVHHATAPDIIFLPKRVNAGMFNLTQAAAKSVDQRASFMASLTGLLPGDYGIIFKLADSFRRLSPLTAALGDTTPIEPELPEQELAASDDVPETAAAAGKRTLLQLTQERLKQVTRQADAAEATGRELMAMFARKTSQLTAAEDAVETTRADLAQVKAQLAAEATRAAARGEELLTKVLELTAARDAAETKTAETLVQLQEVRGQLATQTATSRSLELLNTELELARKEIDKLRGINATLVAELRVEKRAAQTAVSEKQAIGDRLLALESELDHNGALRQTLTENLDDAKRQVTQKEVN